MAELSASVIVGILCVVGIGVSCAGMARNKTAGLNSRNRAMWSFATRAAVLALGLAIWMIARSQIAN